MKHIKLLIQSLVILAVLVGIPVIFEVQYQCDQAMNYPVGSEEEYNRMVEKNKNYEVKNPKRIWDGQKWHTVTPPISPYKGE